MRIIELVPYNEGWPRAFEEEKKALVDLAITCICEIHHIGSTSVEGLASKPIIDILIEVDSLEALDQYQKSIESLGYESKGEFGIKGRRYFRKGKENRTHQIHAFQESSYDVFRHIAFRDYLREYPSVRKKYESLKVQVAAFCDNDINSYCDGKNDFIKLYEGKAMDWVNETSQQGGIRNSRGYDSSIGRS